MIKENYLFETDTKAMFFEFVSEGPKGKIIKIVQFSEINIRNFYNLAFEDKNVKTGKIDDLAITNNKDSQKVLATVASTVSIFFDKHPSATVYVEGSTNARNRLYRIGISNYLSEINKDFEIYGLLGEQWVPFRKNEEYKAFLLRKKH
jgi:hypothetical protein